MVANGTNSRLNDARSARSAGEAAKAAATAAAKASNGNNSRVVIMSNTRRNSGGMVKWTKEEVSSLDAMYSTQVSFHKISMIVTSLFLHSIKQ